MKSLATLAFVVLALPAGASDRILRAEIEVPAPVAEVWKAWTTEEGVRSFLARQGSSYPSLLDPGSRTAIAFGIFGVPETYFLDAEGRIAAKHVGPLDEQTLALKLAQAGVAP